MKAAFSAGSFDVIDTSMQQARNIEAYSPDYEKAVAEVAQQAAAPPSNAQQPPGPGPNIKSAVGSSNTGHVQQDEALRNSVEPFTGQPASGTQVGQTSACGEQLASGLSDIMLFQQGQAF